MLFQVMKGPTVGAHVCKLGQVCEIRVSGFGLDSPPQSDAWQGIEGRWRCSRAVFGF